MQILADENIPLLGDAFGPVGDLEALPADALTPERVRQADALIVRSVTQVVPALLEGSRVRFVATATIGTDHVDEAYLRKRGIGFASAAGSNAWSVVEYVFAALVTLAARQRRPLRGRTLGVVGVGNIGSRVARVAERLGMRVLRNDPPLARSTGDPVYVPLDALAAADIVTFHVPLSRDGPDATYHMIGAPLLARLKRGAALINSSRGSVTDTPALKAAIRAGRLGPVVLDVWENEPEIDLDLAGAAALATPHIAGYSYDGKVNGTRQVLEALCRHFGIERRWDPAPLMPAPRVPRVRLPAGVTVDEAMRQAVRAAYDIEADDARLRAIAREPPDRRAAYFKALRKNYPVRRRWPETAVELGRPDAAVALALEALGFRVAGA
jgi:erythronate-4-phosphate dehydrogenase